MKGKRCLLTAVVLGALTLGPAPAAVARPKVTPGSRYLALGDSVTFGYMERTVAPAPNYPDPASFVAYPEQLGEQLRLRVTNAACPGETTASLIDVTAPSLGCENPYRKHFHLHVRYSGSQLSFAVAFLRTHRNVKLVSLMIGANDYFRCVATQHGCTGNGQPAATYATISRNVRRILSAIRNQAHYRGQLVVVNYYALTYASAAVRQGSLSLNKAIDTGARQFHVAVADGFGTFRTAAVHSGADSCAAGLLTQLGTPGKCGIHPSYAGQALLAQAVAKVLKL